MRIPKPIAALLLLLVIVAAGLSLQHTINDYLDGLDSSLWHLGLRVQFLEWRVEHLERRHR